MASPDDGLEGHYRNVGRVVVSSACLEGTIAQIVYVSSGADLSPLNEGFEAAGSPGGALSSLAQVCKDFPDIDGLTELAHDAKALLRERNDLVHAVVQLASPRLWDRSIRVREGDPIVHEGVLPKSGDRRPLPTDTEADCLVDLIDELNSHAEGFITPIWISANRRLGDDR